MTFSTFIVQCGFSQVVRNKYAIKEVARRANSQNVIQIGGPYS